ncbi:ankyrin repeat-containing domain protein [Armillaria luteobubalina]|uniref:Ankyrin repeat-containing domain protein n=1 Tax=Armillaria luteobubalina TaxID=153913 RepID=A0AA39Q975_9AGAR|nr:ankyrin repeat-containing domain protein [Armillaria luteobubalina]
MAEKDAAARLRRAVKENNLFLVKRLIERTDMRNIDPGPRRYTSLAWAAVLGHEETFEFLLSEGHDDYEFSRDSESNTILMLLADQKPPSATSYHSMPSNDTLRATLRMARLYYDRYPQVLDWSNSQGKTALHIAALRGNEELVRMLCDLNADVDLPDNKGNAPLHSASSWGHITVVQLLIERGCSYTARNNDGFTASDYAYSYSTQETLQDTVRLQFENNKKSRRAIFVQNAARNNEWGGAGPSISNSSQNIRSATPRMRSGSGTSRTTVTSDSGELESNGLTPAPLSQSSLSASSSPSQPSGGSSTPYHAPQHTNGTMSALSPFATRVRERDADAMEKYMKRNRSGSQGTASTDNRSQNGSSSAGAACPSLHEDDVSTNLPPSGSTTPRRLRPSMSASQLLSKPPSLSNSTQPENRIRAGTNPSSSRPSMFPRPLLSRSSSISNSTRPLASVSDNLFEEPENYTGPPSQYAQFPEPPLSPEDNNTPIAGRRMGFHPLVKPLYGIDSLTSHRRGLSTSSFRS